MNNKCTLTSLTNKPDIVLQLMFLSWKKNLYFVQEFINIIGFLNINMNFSLNECFKIKVKSFSALKLNVQPQTRLWK